MVSSVKIVVEKHVDGYVAYPLGLIRGVVLGQGDTREEAVKDLSSAIAFHLETFGAEALDEIEENPILEASVAEMPVSA